MKKPKIRFWNGYWWCRSVHATGQGLTMEEAFNDWVLLVTEFFDGVIESHRISQFVQKYPKGILRYA